MSSIKNTQKNNLTSMLIIGGLFSVFGFVTWINGALIPFMKTINELTESESYLVATASYISFVVMALPSSFVLKKIGYKKGISLGLIIMAIGALVFIPAASAKTYWIFLLAIFLQGTGMTLLQTAANPYITLLGPIESAAKRIAIMGIANKVAGALGSVIFGVLLLSGIDDVNKKLTTVSSAEKETLLNSMANSVVVPYIVMAVVLVVFAMLIGKSALPTVESASEEEIEDSERTSQTSIFHFPNLWLGVIALFVYVGAEVIAGDTIIAYGISLGISAENAKFFTSFTLMAMVATYGLGVVLIPKYISQNTALKVSAVLGIVFSLLIINTTGFTSVFFVAALGIANALVWPAIWPLSINGLGRFTKTGSALLIMAISGGAIIPPLYGKIVDANKISLIQEGFTQVEAIATSATYGYWILIPCYAIILFFAVWGHQLKFKHSR